MSDKQKLGQFYTTRYEYILQNMNIPYNISNIIEPFAGNGDLLNFIENEDINIECFDIDPKKPFINRRDTLVNPPDYDNKFIITNPPFEQGIKVKIKLFMINIIKMICTNVLLKRLLTLVVLVE